MSKKIVIAEDDKFLSDSLVAGFKEAGFEVSPVYDGEAAVNLVKELHPDCLLLDIMMPKLDGIGVMTELKAAAETALLPIIVLTNMADTDSVSKILQAGGTDYLLKSEQSIDGIIEKVREVLARTAPYPLV